MSASKSWAKYAIATSEQNDSAASSLAFNRANPAKLQVVAIAPVASIDNTNAATSTSTKVKPRWKPILITYLFNFLMLNRGRESEVEVAGEVEGEG